MSTEAERTRNRDKMRGLRANPEFRERESAKARSRHASDPSKAAEKKRRYREAHPEYVERQQALTAEWRENNRPRVADLNARRYEQRMAEIDAARDKPCVDCGVRLPAPVMEFDHVRGVKKFTITTGWGRADVWEEIAKCDIRCPTCHRLRHYYERVQRQLAL